MFLSRSVSICSFGLIVQVAVKSHDGKMVVLSKLFLSVFIAVLALSGQDADPPRDDVYAIYSVLMGDPETSHQPFDETVYLIAGRTSRDSLQGRTRKSASRYLQGTSHP